MTPNTDTNTTKVKQSASLAGHRPVIVKGGSDWFKRLVEAHHSIISCKVFRDWSRIKLLERSIHSVHFLKQHLTAFVDLVYWCGLQNMTLHFGIFFQ